MISVKVRSAPKYYGLRDWKPWFAWRPVRAKISSGDVPQAYDAPWRWVWLEWVEGRYDIVRSYDEVFYEYRM